MAAALNSSWKAVNSSENEMSSPSDENLATKAPKRVSKNLKFSFAPRLRLTSAMKSAWNSENTGSRSCGKMKLQFLHTHPHPRPCMPWSCRQDHECDHRTESARDLAKCDWNFASSTLWKLHHSWTPSVYQSWGLRASGHGMDLRFVENLGCHGSAAALPKANVSFCPMNRRDEAINLWKRSER